MATPVILMIIVGLLLVVLALYAVSGLPKGSLSKSKGDIHRKRATIQFIIGLFLSLIGAFLMFNGTILGDNTVPAARIIGIVGILLIGTSFTTLPFMLGRENR